MNDTDADLLNRVDLCFVVDTTGSMGAFLHAAKQHLTQTLDALRAESAIDLRVGLVEYRDHPPQDSSFVTRVNLLTADLGRIQKAINGLSANGGGDAPEAVYDGVSDACYKMPWRLHSCRLALLVGDAPPHGARAHEGRGKPCACGRDLHAVTAEAERFGVTVHAVPVHAFGETVATFTDIAGGTGGECAPAARPEAVIETMKRVLARDFGNLEFDRRALAAVREIGEADTARVTERLGCTRGEAASALARLGRRGLLDELVPALVAA